MDGLGLVIGQFRANNEEVAKGLFTRMDIDRNGHVDYSEFMTAVLDISNTRKEKNLQTIFSIFDSNDDGFFSFDEFEDFFEIGLSDCSSADKLWAEMIKQADTDNDGKISFAEFCKAMTHVVHSNDHQHD